MSCFNLLSPVMILSNDKDLKEVGQFIKFPIDKILTMSVSCQSGVYDCDYDSNGGNCAEYNDRFQDIEGVIWPVIITGMIMCVSAFSIGANDSANAWGTSVGSDAISLKGAVIIAAVCDFLGAVTLGYGVSDTIQKGASDVTDEKCWACGYCNSKLSMYSIGMFAASFSSASFLLVASLAKMPVSATHAIVGAVVGMTVFGVGFDCLDWSMEGLGGIVTSWFLSPTLAGLIGAGTYHLSKKTIIDQDNARERAIYSLPLFYSFTTGIMIYVIMAKSAVTAGVPEVYHIVATFLALLLAGLGTWFIVVPYVKQHLPSVDEENARRLPSPLIQQEKSHDRDLIMPSASGLTLAKIIVQSSQDLAPSVSRQMSKPSRKLSTSKSKGGMSRDAGDSGANGGIAMVPQNEPNALIDTSGIPEVEEDDIDVNSVVVQQADAQFCFKYLVVYIAALMSFAHGANDTANSTATFSAVYTVYKDGLTSCDNIGTEIWIMVIAGGFSSLGTILLGYKVIETVGKEITVLNFHKAFCANIAAVIAVVVSTIFKFPVSTTHCAIGAVICIGYASRNEKRQQANGDDESAPPEEAVSWKTASKIAVSWFVTVPVAALLAAACLAIFTPAIKD